MTAEVPINWQFSDFFYRRRVLLCKFLPRQLLTVMHSRTDSLTVTNDLTQCSWIQEHLQITAAER